MAAPVDAGRAATNITAASTTWNVNYPASIAAGNLLLTWFRTAAAANGGPPGDWDVLASDVSDATDDHSYIYWTVAVGGESGTVAYGFDASVKGAALMWRITGAVNPNEIPLTVSTVAVGTTTANTANPTSVAPTGAPKDTLYVACAGGGGEVGAYTGAPTNYSNLTAANSGTGGAAATNNFIGGATRALLASSSEDPGAFTHGAHVGGWTAFVVAVPAEVLIQNVTPIHVGRPMGLGASY